MKLVLFKSYDSSDVTDGIYFWDGASSIREKFVSFVSAVTFGEFDESKIISEDELREFLDKNCDQEGYDTKPFDSINPKFEFTITIETYRDNIIFV